MTGNINDYVAIDLETTGIRLSKDRIIEVGLVKVKEGHVIDTFSSVVNPIIPIRHEVLSLTGISKSEIAYANYMEDIIEYVIDF